MYSKPYVRLHELLARIFKIHGSADYDSEEEDISVYIMYYEKE
jgi:hypothetical protein